VDAFSLITVTLVVNFFPKTEAVIVAVPYAFAVTFPEEETVATALLLVDHLTVLEVPYTFSVLVEPTANVAVAAFSLITVTLADYLFPETEAVIVTIPGALAVTLPPEDTAAIDLLLEVHLTVFDVP
jgi:hypothetical protein